MPHSRSARSRRSVSSPCHAKGDVLASLTSASGQRTYGHAIQVIRRVVLLGAAAGIQPDGRAPVSHPSRTAALRARHHQPSTRRRAARGLRGGGRRSPQSRTGRRHSPRQGRPPSRRAVGPLADAGAGTPAAHAPHADHARVLRDHAMLAVLLDCGLHRGELLALDLASVQQREDHWVIADLIGKGGHVRTVPVPVWVKAALDAWTSVGGITSGAVSRAIDRRGRVWGNEMTDKVLWDVVRTAAAEAGIEKLAPHDLRRTCARLCHLAGGELDPMRRDGTGRADPRSALRDLSGVSPIRGRHFDRRRRHHVFTVGVDSACQLHMNRRSLHMEASCARTSTSTTP
jgi:integrase